MSEPLMTEQALLGLATTDRLLDELETRFRVAGRNDLGRDISDVRTSATDELLAYRTYVPPEDRAVWTCEIGTADRATLPDDADSPLRQAVFAAFEKVTGHTPAFHSSGWGSSAPAQDGFAVEDPVDPTMNPSMPIFDLLGGVKPAEPINYGAPFPPDEPSDWRTENRRAAIRIDMHQLHHLFDLPTGLQVEHAYLRYDPMSIGVIVGGPMLERQPDACELPYLNGHWRKEQIVGPGDRLYSRWDWTPV